MATSRSQDPQWSPEDLNWPLGQWYQTKTGLRVREVPGDKRKPWSHEPDRKIQVLAAAPTTFTMYDQILMALRVARNEDRLFPQPRFKGACQFWEMMADVPLLGLGAYEKHVEEPRRRVA